MQRIQRLATHDEVTGCFNRYHVMDLLEREAAKAESSGTTFSICLIDIDYFKRVNDGYGHAAGDHVLARVAAIAQGALRLGDCFARYGGEEFILLLPDARADDAQACAERIRRDIAAAHMRHEENQFNVTVSIGVAEFQPGEAVKKTIARADKALYCAKHEGRNRSVTAEPAIG
jgi:diguanylate cyclase (GGDEF)-like protein